MDERRMIRNKLLAEKVIKGLESRNMEGFYAETREDALKTALELIPEGSSVGWGGSVSVDAIGLKEAVWSGNYQIYDRNACKNEEEKRETELAVLGSDFLLSSTNAITEDGILVNIDGRGNRVAGIVYGPRNVIIVAGMNKVVKNVQSGLDRIRTKAAPPNTVRLNRNTPCAKTGVCSDCFSPDCICSQIVVTRRSGIPGRIKIILVNEDLGF